MDGQLSSSASLFFKFFKKILFEIMCMYVSLYMCVCPHGCTAHEDPKRAEDLLGL